MLGRLWTKELLAKIGASDDSVSQYHTCNSEPEAISFV